MADPTPPTSSGIQVSEELRAQFPDLIPLILGSESMNDEERQYWLSILPIMTPDQVKNLQDILENERNQLKAIDDKYAKQLEEMGQPEALQAMDQQIRARRAERSAKEHASETAEEHQTEELLKEIDQAA